MKLEYYGGDGYGDVPENGEYSVKYSEEKERKFTELSKTRAFYNSLNEGKAL